MRIYPTFAGPVSYYNSHYTLIPGSSVIMITFNASWKLNDNIIFREGSLTHQPPECQTVILDICLQIKILAPYIHTRSE